MKIFKINSNVKFGLKIVKNNDYENIVKYRKEQGESQREIDASFERISKLYDGNLTLELCNSKKEYFDILGFSEIMSNIKLKGFMRAFDSNKLYAVDRYETKKCAVGSESSLRANINDLLKQEQKRIDAEDWGE